MGKNWRDWRWMALAMMRGDNLKKLENFVLWVWVENLNTNVHVTKYDNWEIGGIASIDSISFHL